MYIIIYIYISIYIIIYIYTYIYIILLYIYICYYIYIHYYILYTHPCSFQPWYTTLPTYGALSGGITHESCNNFRGDVRRCGTRHPPHRGSRIFLVPPPQLKEQLAAYGLWCLAEDPNHPTIHLDFAHQKTWKWCKKQPSLEGDVAAKTGLFYIAHQETSSLSRISRISLFPSIVLETNSHQPSKPRLSLISIPLIGWFWTRRGRTFLEITHVPGERGMMAFCRGGISGVAD